MKVVNYVKSKYDSTLSPGEAYHLFLQFADVRHSAAMLSLWFNMMFDSHEAHIGMPDYSLLDQYLVTTDGEDE